MMKRRLIIVATLVVFVPVVVSAVVLAYGQNLSFPAARRYVVTQDYDADHNAYDYAFPNHHSVVAVRSGSVVASDWGRVDNDRWYPCRGDNSDRGNYIILDHGGELRTYYYHLSNTGGTPGVGTSFQRGGLMALGDNTGCSTASHLHYAVTVGGKAQDPYAGNTDFVSGSPLPMGYRDQSGNVRGPFGIDNGSIHAMWLALEGEPGSPVDNDFQGLAAGQDATGTTLYDRVQPFEHGVITVSGAGTSYTPYAETYLPDVRADKNSSNWNSTIFVRNNSTVAAEVSVMFYAQDDFYSGYGRALESRTYYPSLPPRALWTINVKSVLSEYLNEGYGLYPDTFQGSAIVYANQDVSVAVRTLNLDSQESLAYSGTPSSSALGFQASSTVLFPNYLHGWGPNNPPYYTGNWYSYLNILNAGSVPTTIKVRFHGWDGTTGNVDIPDVPPNGSIQIEPPDGAATTGGVRVVSEDPPQPLAATITHYFALNPRSGAEAALSVGADTLHLPSVFKAPPPNGYWQCSINLFNTEETATEDCTIHFYHPDGSEYTTAPCSPGGKRSQTIGLAGLGQIADGWWGSAVVEADKMLIAAVFQENVTNNDWQSYNGFKDGVSVLSLPWLQHGSESWNGSLTVTNVGCSSTQVTAYFYSSSGTQLGTSTVYDFGLHETHVFDVADTSTRSALVTTTPSCPVVAIVNEMNTTISDGGVSYNAVD